MQYTVYVSNLEIHKAQMHPFNSQKNVSCHKSTWQPCLTPLPFQSLSLSLSLS